MLQVRISECRARRGTYALAAAEKHRGKARELCIDATFGGYPLNKFTRTYISEWVQRMSAADKKPSTVRHAYFLVWMVLEQAVVDGRLAENPAEYVKLPSERRALEVRRESWMIPTSCSPPLRFRRWWTRRLGRTT